MQMQAQQTGCYPKITDIATNNQYLKYYNYFLKIMNIVLEPVWEPQLLEIQLAEVLARLGWIGLYSWAKTWGNHFSAH